MPTAVKKNRCSIRLPVKLEHVERLVIEKTLRLYQGNKPRTAESLGISLKTLYNKLNRYARVED